MTPALLSQDRFGIQITCMQEDEPLGTILGPVKTQFGHHLIKVVQRGEP